MICKIIRFVRQGHGRFLQKESDGSWYEIGNARAYAKLAQSMREGSSVASICRELIESGAPPRETERNDSPSHRKRGTDSASSRSEVPPVPKQRRLNEPGSPSLPPRKRWV